MNKQLHRPQWLFTFHESRWCMVHHLPQPLTLHYSKRLKRHAVYKLFCPDIIFSSDFSLMHERIMQVLLVLNHNKSLAPSYYIIAKTRQLGFKLCCIMKKCRDIEVAHTKSFTLSYTECKMSVSACLWAPPKEVLSDCGWWYFHGALYPSPPALATQVGFSHPYQFRWPRWGFPIPTSSGDPVGFEDHSDVGMVKMEVTALIQSR